MENLFEEIGIPKRYIKSTCRDNRFIVLVHKSWLKSLVKHMKLIDFIEKPKLEIWPNQDDEIDKSWLKIFITIYNKKRDVKVIPLPRIRSTSKDESPLLFPKFMQYIHQTNYKNLWKDAYKKYNNNNVNNNSNNKGESSKDTTITLVDYNDVLKEILLRIYGCPIVNIYNNCLNIARSKSIETHLNILPALCGIETLNAIFLLHYPYIEHNLNDCITFSPAILNKSYTKPLFIIYQLLNVLKSLHSNSLTLGDITLNDIYLNEDMWIYIFPMVHSNIYIENNCVDQQLQQQQQYDCRKYGHRFDYLTLKCEICGIKTYDRIQLTNDENLEELCQLWINGQISNFTYISILNRLSGRQLNNPNCHYVYPWITDFQTSCGRNWRDLKKSKYRLNKGDRQLDLTYNQNTTTPPHHVSDILSSITYYVYMARRTSKAILCKNVRTKWVPAEYPSSIQRLQEWTPDECIPEFFTDPNVFRSIHDDLDDLDIPQWATSPEDFIERHRELLESQHVSERLHHWIDLTFGYKLSGTAAIKAKNVCLNLVDDHSKLTKSGIVQLFTHPHPAKCTNLPYFGKKPPKIIINKPIKYKSSKDRSTSPTSLDTKSDDNLDDCNNDDDNIDNNVDDCDDVTITNSNRSPLGLTRFLSRSRSSLNDEQQKSNKQTNNQRSSSVGPKNPTFNSYTNPKTNNKTIYLPKDYKPEQALENLEKRYNFFSKTFHIEQKKTTITNQQQQQQINQQVVEKNDDLIVQNAFTNLIFTENFERNPFKQLNSFTKRSKKNQIICNYSEIVSSRRIRELQILGCLIIEIFMSKQLRSLGGNHPNLIFQQRLNYCLTIIKSCQNDIPICIKKIIDLLLLQPIDNNDNNFKYPPVNDIGLPPPSAHLLLEPLLHCLIPFPKLLPNLYKLIWNLKEFDLIAYELEIYYYFDCNGKQCKEYENLERTKLKLIQNIGECKVKICAKQLDEYFNNNNDNNLNNELIDILIMNIKQLINDPPTSILTVWYLFDMIARFLGTKKTSELLLDSIIKLYENDNYYQLLPSYYYKIAKLYHHSFLLRLIVRFGLKCFLENFIQPLVEAVGKYKDYDHNNDDNNVILHDHSNMKTINQQKKQSHLKTMSDNNEQQQSNPSTSDDSSLSDLIDKRIDLDPEPEVFQFDNDENNLHKQKDEELKNLIEQLELNVTNVVDEEGLDVTTTINDNFEQLKINLNNTTDNSTNDNDTVITNLNDTIKCDIKISEMSSDSLIWLSHRLGPVLTARYLTRNLLKMLTLCYVGLDNLNIINNNNNSDNNDINSICIVNSYVQGDRNAIKVLQCLTNIAGLYGEQFILFQYIPHMSELIVLCKRKLTLNLEGGLISSLALLKHIIPYVADSTLMEQLQDVILKNILQPIVRLLGSIRYSFPNGSISRNILARKFIDTLYILSIRLGVDMTRTHLITPTLQRFFLIFDKSSNDDLFNDDIGDSDGSYIELCRDGTIKEWTLIDGKPIQIQNKDHDYCINHNNEEIIDELNAVFTPELAYIAYLPFLRFVGLESLKISLKNHENIQRLCEEYENCGKITIPIVIKFQQLPPSKQQPQQQLSSSIGSNVAVIGNRLDVQQQQLDMNNRLDLLNLVSKRIDNNDRHLRGNWLAYWEHEIGRSTKDLMFNFKQIKLQQFVGHTNSVKCLYLLDNENSFISGSRDKTIKLWSLRSHGDGNHIQTCQWTYTLHKKSILSLIFIDSLRLVASCDSLINIWDPFMGINIGNIDTTKYQPVNLLKNLSIPSQLFYATTTDCILHIVDTRLCSFIYDMKLNLNQTINGLIRCLAVSPSGYWVAAGQSSGYITILDSRTGFVISTWRAHESEVLQLIAYNDTTLISTSLDQTVSVWNTNDGRFKFHMRGATEPVHCLNIYNNELISGTTANRIGVHTSIDIDASFSSTKLRSDAFKGLLTSMTVLPLNRLLLLGADTGNISLLC